MTQAQLTAQVFEKSSMLCVGLDPVLEKLPPHLLDYEDPVFEFCKQIIDQTKDVAVAYKPNIAFFECLGPKGWLTLEKVVHYMPSTVLKIADAKRGDIGNTSKMYAKTFFEYLPFDAVTVAPYMGIDSVTPFLEFENKWVILLGLTSNEGSNNFQRLPLQDHMPLWEKVIREASTWASPDQLMFVIGATHGQDFSHVRSLVPDHFLLVPGVGAQGGSLQTVMEAGSNQNGGLLINNARNIIYASSGIDFAQQARHQALATVDEMKWFFEK